MASSGTSNCCMKLIQESLVCASYPLSESCSISFIFSSCWKMCRWTPADALQYLLGAAPRRLRPGGGGVVLRVRCDRERVRVRGVSMSARTSTSRVGGRATDLHRPFAVHLRHTVSGTRVGAQTLGEGGGVKKTERQAGRSLPTRTDVVPVLVIGAQLLVLASLGVVHIVRKLDLLAPGGGRRRGRDARDIKLCS